ncbi:hypothetical protein ACFVAD_16380 [Sutcliffiella sp. NPDC057660]|uniref:hypothetical protein n=1 Tax=Sutcliffiella sp. NPDC057660 TaxID=3346199 RepID=UPI0036BE4E3C
MRRRRQRQQLVLLLLGAGLLGIIIYLFSSILISAEGKAERVVEDFYAFEQEGDYGRSWELLHSSLHDKFSRGSYIQDRAHVFNGHFGAETFTYEVSDAEKLNKWKMEKGGKVFETAFEFEVVQTYQGKYGHFEFVQYVYVVEEKDEWKVVWDYKK